MKPFHLKIVTPYGPCFDSEATYLQVRTVDGDVGIMADHADMVTALGMGRAIVDTENGRREAACIGGLMSVTKDLVSLVATTFEWAEDIDVSRADTSYEKAQKILGDKNATDLELKLAQARLKRALVRKSVAGMNQN